MQVIYQTNNNINTQGLTCKKYCNKGSSTNIARRQDGKNPATAVLASSRSDYKAGATEYKFKARRGSPLTFYCPYEGLAYNSTPE
jgi:hypothetical protein